MMEHPKLHVSRLDVQVTVQYDIELIKEGRYQYARSIHHDKGLPEYRRRKIHLYAGSDGGDTVYVGSPSSDNRGRIYNKAKQSNEQAYERCWRYEVVLRNEYALHLYRRMPSEVTEATKLILSYVSQWYAERGVNILGLELGHANIGTPPKQPATDVDRKLRWIRNQVVPTIRKLAELGYAEELMEAIAEAIASGRDSQT
jgi:DNA relaxase NicK